MLEANSFTNEDQILDTDIVVEEIEKALKALKLGRSKGADGLNLHLLSCGTSVIVLWLKKIFNAIISLEDVPQGGCYCSYLYKGKGKYPLCTSSYHSTMLSSVIANTLEVVIFISMSPILDELGFPDINQTLFQRGISCADAIFSTQEVLLNYIPFICFYNIEKALKFLNFQSYYTVCTQLASEASHGNL